MSHHVAEYLAAGMDSHVAKPIEALRLFEALQTAIHRPSSEHEPVVGAQRRAGQAATG
jgi:CheY-like chemotaxis protein